MAKRSGKFYYRNEAETMERLGMHQVVGSGNGWVSKEDGENENLLCQLKSTDASSISIKKLDIDKLLIHATTTHKLPIFAIQFLKSSEVFLVVRPEDISDVAKYINTGVVEEREQLVEADEETHKIKRRVIRSSPDARESFRDEVEKKYEKKRKSAV